MARSCCIIDIDALLRAPQWVDSPVETSPCELLAKLTEVDLVIVSTATKAQLDRRLSAAGLQADQFAAAHAELDLAAHRPSTLAAAHRETAESQHMPLFVVSADKQHIHWASSDTDPDRPVVPILLAGQDDETALWDGHDAWFVARDLGEAAALIAAPRRPHSLSVVLMAYNEMATITTAIEEVRRFCRLYLHGYEIIVVDDGSNDDTQALALQANVGDVHLIRHPKNQGMGASMRDGYALARCDYVTSLPADRQVRAQSLAPFMAHLDPSICVHSHYSVPHSGGRREIMSTAFRLLRQRLGGLTVDYAGAYVFHRDWLDQIDLGRLRSNSFVFSYELLQRLKELGCGFQAVSMRAFPRTSGTSRVARPSRILKVAAEVLYSRAAREVDRLLS